MMPLDSVNSLHPHQAATVVALEGAFKRNMFSTSEAMRVLANSNSVSVTTHLNNLVMKCALRKIRRGYYAVADYQSLLPVKAAPVTTVPINDPSTGAPIKDLEAENPFDWMRAIGVDIKRRGHAYVMNGRMPLSEETMVRAANWRRKKYGLPAFQMVTA